MKFSGRISKITPEITVGQNAIPKITFVVEEVGDMEDYKRNSVAVDVLGEKTEMIKNRREGDEVTVYINLKHSEYNDRLYNRVTAWKIEDMNESGSNDSSSSSSQEAPADDLPF